MDTVIVLLGCVIYLALAVMQWRHPESGTARWVLVAAGLLLLLVACAGFAWFDLRPMYLTWPMLVVFVSAAQAGRAEKQRRERNARAAAGL